jgi:sugar (pentulose or hexulose) kinase
VRFTKSCVWPFEPHRKITESWWPINTARLAGGGSRVWCGRNVCDMIQVPIEITDGNELGARGAALSAGIGAGIYKNYAEAVQAAVFVVRTHEPVPAIPGCIWRGYIPSTKD